MVNVELSDFTKGRITIKKGTEAIVIDALGNDRYHIYATTTSGMGTIATLKIMEHEVIVEK